MAQPPRLRRGTPSGRCVLLLALLSMCTAAACITPEELPAAIHAILAQPAFDRSVWGVYAKSAAGDVLFSHNERQFFTPASNCKLLTTSAFFASEGATYYIATPMKASTAAHGSTVLCMQGRGDPTWTQADTHQEVAEKLKQSGISNIDALAMDDSAFPPLSPPTWEWEDLGAGYGARPNSFITDQNAIKLTVTGAATTGQPPSVSFDSAADSKCVPLTVLARTVTTVEHPLQVFYTTASASLIVSGDIKAGAQQSVTVASLAPAQRFFCTLNNTLARNGIHVHSVQWNATCGVGDSARWATLFSIKAPPTRYTMNWTLQESDNLFAESFLRTLGLLALEGGEQSGMPADQAGIAQVKEILGGIGVNGSSFYQVDGSGLSRRNLVSPESLHNLLVGMKNVPDFDVYRTFLPVGGESGTLKSRFKGTSAQGRVHAKTGTETGVNALSGYVDASDAFPEVIFSVLVNQSNQPASVVRQGIDAIVELLADLST